MFNLRGYVPPTALALMLGLAAQGAAAQQSYPQTLYWGSGLVDIPVAWVSPATGDFSVGYTGQTMQVDGSTPGTRTLRVNAQGAGSISLLGRAEVGVALFSSNPEWGFFGRALLIDARDFGGFPELQKWMPNVAVGVRNVGPFSRIDRFGVGYDLDPTNPGTPHVLEPSHAKFNTGNTVYVVATKGFAFAPSPTTGVPLGSVSASVGFGNGLFTDDGGLGRFYASHSTGGVFGGVEASLNAGSSTSISVMLENDAWDYNAGLVVDYHGVRAGAYLTQIGSSSPIPGVTDDLYNSSKFAFTFGWRGNVLGLAHDNVLKNRVAELERQRTLLLSLISMREERVVELDLQLKRYEAQGLLDLEDRRAQAEQELREQHDTLQRLRDRLRQLQQEEAIIAIAPAPAGKSPR
ncbi:MAG TPA: hypothetical protein VF166_14340 [Gemmatimonadaceae bacterium]